MLSLLLPPQCLLSVTSSPVAPVGKYTLNVKTGNNIYKPENGEVYLLFNPWCEGEWSCNHGDNHCSLGSFSSHFSCSLSQIHSLFSP